jgi:hypothetical protein
VSSRGCHRSPVLQDFSPTIPTIYLRHITDSSPSFITITITIIAHHRFPSPITYHAYLQERVAAKEPH